MRPGRLVAMTLLALAAALPAVAVEYEVQSWQTEPGTEVVLIEDHRVPLVSVVIEFPVGHWSPWATEQHAEEAFDIQSYDPAGSLRSRADRLAVDLGVGMGSHAASVSVSALKEDLEAVLALVEDVLSNRDFDRHELQRWNKSGKLEWNGSQKVPQFRLGQTAARLLFAEDDPRRRSYEKPRKKSTDIERLVEARDVVVRIPGRAIGFAGDVTRAEADRFARGLLPPVVDDLPDGLEPLLQPMTPMDELPGEQVVAMPRIQQTFFAYGRHSLTYDDPRYPAFLIADHVLGGHFFSRMNQALRHEGGETYGSGTIGEGGVYAEGYALTTFTRGENTAATDEKLREVLRLFHAEGITEEERNAATGFLLGRRPFSRQAPSQILGRYLSERRLGLPAGFNDQLIDRAVAVPLDEINALIREFYDPERFSMLTVTPK